MPLDEPTQRLALGLEREVRAVKDREQARAERGEEIRWDPVSRMITWESQRGEVIGRWYGEVIATYVSRDRILRWSWAGKSIATHAESIARAGNDRGLPQFVMSLVDDLDEADAFTLARLGIVVARGQGMHVERGELEVELIGLFDSARPRDGDPNQYSVPPPVVLHSSPPARLTNPPPTKIREPARAVFVPVANAVLARLAKTAANYRQALFIIEAEPVHMSLVILDSNGLLRTIESSAIVVDAAARMIAADQADGNGPWKKLTARITPKPDGGATLAVDVL